MDNFKKINCAYDIGYSNFRLSVLYNNLFHQSLHRIYIKEKVSEFSYILVDGIKFKFNNIKFYPL